MNAAIHQLAKHIRIPNASSCGLSDSKLPDSQASWESGMLVLAAAMEKKIRATRPSVCPERSMATIVLSKVGASALFVSADVP